MCGLGCTGCRSGLGVGFGWGGHGQMVEGCLQPCVDESVVRPLQISSTPAPLPALLDTPTLSLPPMLTPCCAGYFICPSPPPSLRLQPKEMGLPVHAYVAKDEIREDGTEKSKKVGLRNRCGGMGG